MAKHAPGGPKLTEAIEYYTHMIYSSADFEAWVNAGPIMGQFAKYFLKTFVWQMIYPYSTHSSPPAGFCNDIIEDKLSSLRTQYMIENAESPIDVLGDIVGL